VRLAWMRHNIIVGFSPENDEELMISYELYLMQLGITIGLIAANLPALRSIFRTESFDITIKHLRSLFSLKSGTSSDGSMRNSKDYCSERIKAITITVISDFGVTGGHDNRVSVV